jgi:DNA-binding transcriptional regulator YiaG
VETSAGNELAILLRETADGERSNNLVKIAGMLRARGIDLETALDVMAHNFEEHWPHEGMTWDEARNTFERAWKRYEHEGVRYGKGQAAQDDNDDEELEAVWIEDITPPTEKDALIEKFVLAGEAGNTVLAAPAKEGKTSLVLDAVITGTRGEPAWGLLKVSKALKVAYVDQERKYQQIRENQLMMAPVIGEPAPHTLLMLTQKTGNFEMGHSVMDRLRGRLEEFGPDLVVIDGWGWLVGHRESDPDYVKPALAWLKAIRQSLNCATIVIHHFKKAQFASRGEHGEVTDILDQIAGLKRLVDQAQTALVYVPIAGYDTFNLLDGRTNKPSWDPIKTVIDYDHTTLTHRAVSADEGAELFDPDTYRNLWGTASAESRQVKGMLNTIRNRFGFNQQELATRVGVDRTQISRWYSGRQNPSREAMEKLKALYREAKERPVKSAKMPRPARQTKGLGDR